MSFPSFLSYYEDFKQVLRDKIVFIFNKLCCIIYYWLDSRYIL
ncbi:hypothetical protein OZD61_05860 [Wolbachia endosymbiont of Drosophila bocki]|nr:hypothetical protein [Wolbachia endosymbiont of Drosophila bocki]